MSGKCLCEAVVYEIYFFRLVHSCFFQEKITMNKISLDVEIEAQGGLVFQAIFKHSVRGVACEN